MLTIWYKDPDKEPEIFNWEIGTGHNSNWNELRKVINSPNRSVLMLIADSFEKDHIKMTFHNIPMLKEGKCIWRGEIAQFIADNFDF